MNWAPHRGNGGGGAAAAGRTTRSQWPHYTTMIWGRQGPPRADAYTVPLNGMEPPLCHMALIHTPCYRSRSRHCELYPYRYVLAFPTTLTSTLFFRATDLPSRIRRPCRTAGHRKPVRHTHRGFSVLIIYRYFGHCKFLL